MLVGAFACAHTPQLIVRPETEDRELVLRVHGAFARVRRRLAMLQPDAIAVVAGDHVEAFFLDAVPALAVYAGTEAAGTFGPYEYRYPIHEPLARAIVEQGIERGFDLHVNVYLPPQPTPRRCHTWGRTLGDILGSRPERVVLMASGGMSHYPGTDRYGSPDYDWDRRVLDALRDGRAEELASMTGEELDKAGNVELRTWLTVLGAVGSAKAEIYCYEPSWHHGNAVVEWQVPR